MTRLLSLFMSAFLVRSSVAFVARRSPRTHAPRYSAVLRMMSSSSTHTADSLLLHKTLVSVKDAMNAQASGFHDVKFVDGSWFLKGRNARDEYERGPRIPHAVYFDIDRIATSTTSTAKNLPHMMPSRHLFATCMDALDIRNSDHLIVYASQDCMFLHRAWIQILSMGHDRARVHLMQGSLEDWKQAGGPLEEGQRSALDPDALDVSVSSSYVATDPQNVISLQEMKEIVESQSDIVVDVRARERFLGQVEEPRPNLRLGHMPGALNIPFLDLLNPENVVQFKSESELRDVFASAGLDIDTEQRIVASCGSGATACALAGALLVCGRDPAKTCIYDGSWMDWGSETDTPVVKDE